MAYGPLVKSANFVAEFNLNEEYQANLFNDITAEGRTQYEFIFAVFKRTSRQYCFYVTSEVNKMAKRRGNESGSHFLCSFLGDAHLNHGDSDAWTDQNMFTQRAIELAKKHLARLG
jgi:hypothetical protein